MTVLARSDIKAIIDNGNLKIDPFNSDRLEPASYDCLLGEIIAAGAGRIEWGHGDEFILPANSWCSISSEEKFEIPKDICATYGIRSRLARRGIVAFGGPQIDPGYKGRIFISLYNPTFEPIVLKHRQEIFSLTFLKLSSEDEKGYEGTYQGQNDFPSSDVEFMMRVKSHDLAKVVSNVKTLDDSVKNLAKNLETLTSDVHSIRQDLVDFRQELNVYRPWIKGLMSVIATAAISAIAWIVTNLLSLF